MLASRSGTLGRKGLLLLLLLLTRRAEKDGEMSGSALLFGTTGTTTMARAGRSRVRRRRLVKQRWSSGEAAVKQR